MKHGDKAKAKSAKEASQAPGKKGAGKGVEAGAKSSVKAIPKEEATKAGKPPTGKKGSSAKAAAEPREAASPAVKARARVPEPEKGFSDPSIGVSFERAVKKYPNAFRRLTD